MSIFVFIFQSVTVVSNLKQTGVFLKITYVVVRNSLRAASAHKMCQTQQDIENQ